MSEVARWPMTVALGALLTGELDEKRLVEAVTEAVMAHPLAHARLAPSPAWSRHAYWEIPDELDLNPVVSGLSAAELLSTPIELSTSPPLRVALWKDIPDGWGLPAPSSEPPHPGPAPGSSGPGPGPGGTSIAIVCNHAAFDGVGLIRMLDATLSAYAGVRLRSEASDLADLEQRGPRTSDSAGSRPAGRATKSAPGRPWRPSLKISGDGDPGASGYGIMVIETDPPRLPEALPRAGAVARPTVNDVLVAALHLAIASWASGRQRSGRLSLALADSGLVSVVVPVYLGGRDGPEPPVANATLQTTTFSTPAERSEPRLLLQAIAAQTHYAKEGRAVRDPTGVLHALALAPYRIRSLLPPLVGRITNDFFAASARLSNLGVQEPRPHIGSGPAGEGPSPASGAPVVERLWFSPPCRPPQGIVLGAVTTNGRLSLSARWCRSAFSDSDARCFLELYLQELQRLQA